MLTLPDFESRFNSFDPKKGSYLMHFIPLFLTLLLCFTPLPSQAEDETLQIQLGYGLIEGFIEKDGTGPGNEMLQGVVERLRNKGYGVTTHRQPFKRVISTFVLGKFDAIFPIINSGDLPSGGYEKWGYARTPLTSIPLYNGGRFVIYTHKNQPKRDSVESLKNLKIGVLTGIYIPSVLRPPTDYRIEEIFSATQAFKMLSANRIDALVMHDRWARSILDENPSEEIHHGEPFGTILGGFIVQQEETGARNLAHINQALAEMIMDGTYNRILDRYPNALSIVRPPK
jgi:ABC-type amino acid transport substrate-binding protein